MTNYNLSYDSFITWLLTRVLFRSIPTGLSYVIKHLFAHSFNLCKNNSSQRSVYKYIGA